MLKSPVLNSGCAAAIVTVLVACGRGDGYTRDSIQTAAGTAWSRVLTQGTEPRHTLLYSLNSATGSAILDWCTTIETKHEKKTKDEFALRIRFAWTVRPKNGFLEVRFVPECVMIDKAPNDSDWAQSLSLLKNMVGSRVVTRRGLATSTEFQWDAGFPIEIVSDTLETVFRSIPVPLPNRVVGQGAKWDVETPVSLLGHIRRQKATYLMKTLDRHRGEVDFELHPVKLGYVRAIDIKSLELVGRGSLAFDSRDFIPTLDIVLRCTIHRGTNEWTSVMRTRIKVTPCG